MSIENLFICIGIGNIVSIKKILENLKIKIKKTGVQTIIYYNII